MITKVAICFGSNYKKPYELKSGTNDAKLFETFFTKHGFKTKLYTDPDKNTVIKTLKKLIRLSHKTKLSAFIYYNGHSIKIPVTKKGQKTGKYEECLCPSDIKNLEFITNTELSVIFSHINLTARVVIITDVLHSGNLLNLELYDNLPIICISSCQSNTLKPYAMTRVDDRNFTGDLTFSILMNERHFNSNIATFYLAITKFRMKLKAVKKNTYFSITKGCNYDGSIWDFLFSL